MSDTWKPDPQLPPDARRRVAKGLKARRRQKRSATHSSALIRLARGQRPTGRGKRP